MSTTIKGSRSAHMPSDVSGRLSLFDRFASAASRFFSRAWFFAFCLLLVVVWAPSYFLIGTVDTWQLIINTITTIVTFLMVALLQNSQTRADAAVQDKLNAVAAALAALMDHSAEAEAESDELRDATSELRKAVGLEERESS
ncbi:low affinity iron permease family protein [Kribbella sp. NBC_01245]|uniref:low affinity iron permease family protein n=1 Tax=Kribbella sp. NBC_01245 TaxID=2903578 RepID=UPI002E284BAA|nr:low affinity iron permease family protein [Kribbella sp. NBC_01245]